MQTKIRRGWRVTSIPFFNRRYVIVNQGNLKRSTKKNYVLFWSLSAYFLLPFLYQCVRTNLIADIPSVDGLGIAGHIEWFDLINETIQAFLIVPLYHLFNTVAKDREKLSGRIRVAFLVSTIVYVLFSVGVLMSLPATASFMAASQQATVVSYLRWETVAFICGHVGSFAAVVFVIAGRPQYINALTVGKVGLTVIGDLMLIPAFGVNGIAYSNIATNSIAGALCFLMLRKENLFVPATQMEPIGWLKDWARVGLFSGVQIFLDNIIYALIVCKMVNEVAEQGNYWVANNFIWGVLLVPTMALAEIIKRENSPQSVMRYLKTTIIIACGWIAFIPIWMPFFRYVLGIGEAGTIFRIVLMLLPFYIAYGVSSVFSSLFTAMGKTIYNTIISIIVNIGYYGVMYGAFLAGAFKPSIEFICILFGGGMLINSICGVLLFLFSTCADAARA